MKFADGNDDEEILLKLRSLSDDPYLTLKERDHVKVSMQAVLRERTPKRINWKRLYYLMFHKDRKPYQSMI